MVRIAARLSRVEPSATLAITARAAALKAQGVDVIGFGAGEPDFNTPAPIIEAAKRALDEGLTKYSPVAGLASLRAAIASDYVRRYDVPTKPSEVLVGCGGKHVLYNIAACFCEAGDKVLIPTPYWVSYPAQALLADAEPVFLETTEADNFLVTPAALDAALTEHKPRLLILNSPSNPTGTAYTRDQLAALLDVLRRHPDTFLVWDAIYERLTYDGFEHTEPTTLAPDLRDRTFIVNGFSKTFAMTGWRLGYVIAPTPLIAAMDNFQSHTTSGATTFAQAAAVEALNLPQSAIDEMVATFDGRRRRMLALLSEIPLVTCARPQGAFYAFPNFSAYIGAQFNGQVIADDLALTAFLLEEGRVALVPGSAFGAPGFMRLSYATSMKAIEEGLQRTAQALLKLTR
jgi:aspartate aminotransferase